MLPKGDSRPSVEVASHLVKSKPVVNPKSQLSPLSSVDDRPIPDKETGAARVTYAYDARGNQTEIAW